MTVIIKPKLSRPCLLTQGWIDKKGYAHVRHNGKTKPAHRVAYCKHHGLELSDIKGVVIRHKCDNPSCIEPTHLEPGTQTQNMKDRDMRGRQARGEANGRAKLTDDDVRQIRLRIQAGATQLGIAAAFGVDPKVIRNIKSGKSWRHVTASIPRP